MTEAAEKESMRWAAIHRQSVISASQVAPWSTTRQGDILEARARSTSTTRIAGSFVDPVSRFGQMRPPGQPKPAIRDFRGW